MAFKSDKSAVDRDWNLTMVKAREAYSLLKRNSESSNKVDWRDVTVGHIDTGVTTNPVFRWNSRGESDFMLTQYGANFRELSQTPNDPLDYDGEPGHGTRTSSVLTGNLPGTFVGVAPTVRVVPYRVTNSVVLSKKIRRANIANAIRHAVDINRCDVISISLGWPLLSWFSDRPMGEAVDYAYENGVIVVAAGGQIVDAVCYPGKYYRSIGVGGVEADYSVWQKYGNEMQSFIDVWAPASPIYRANTEIVNGQEEYKYGYGDGTSYATVHVAGAAAMWLTYKYDELESAYSEPWHRVEAFRSLLKGTHQKVEGPYEPQEGTGILDAHALLTENLPRKSKLKYETNKAVDMYA